METPDQPLTMNQSIFLSQLRNEMNRKIYFYGSIVRGDYIPSLSDIDVLYFADDTKTECEKMLRFMKKNKKHENVRVKSKRFLYHSSTIKHIISGYKVKYEDMENAVPIEVTIYDKKYEDAILAEQQKKSNIPFWMAWMLIVLKVLAYKFKFIPKELFKKIKEKLFIYISGIPATFVILKQ